MISLEISSRVPLYFTTRNCSEKFYKHISECCSSSSSEDFCTKLQNSSKDLSRTSYVAPRIFGMVSQISLKISPENSFKYSSRISLDDSVVDFIDDCSKTSSVCRFHQNLRPKFFCSVFYDSCRNSSDSFLLNFCQKSSKKRSMIFFLGISYSFEKLFRNFVQDFYKHVNIRSTFEDSFVIPLAISPMKPSKILPNYLRGVLQKFLREVLKSPRTLLKIPPLEEDARIPPKAPLRIPLKKINILGKLLRQFLLKFLRSLLQEFFPRFQILSSCSADSL